MITGIPAHTTISHTLPGGLTARIDLSLDGLIREDSDTYRELSDDEWALMESYALQTVIAFLKRDDDEVGRLAGIIVALRRTRPNPPAALTR